MLALVVIGMLGVVGPALLLEYARKRRAERELREFITDVATTARRRRPF
jgi:Flp pilus assembly protein TadB